VAEAEVAADEVEKDRFISHTEDEEELVERDENDRLRLELRLCNGDSL